MGAVGKLRKVQTSEHQFQYMFYCPGCECYHAFNETWKFNGNMEKPTVYPSLLSQGVIKCHLFIEDGKLRYLSDSQHQYAGKTIEMVDEKDD